MDFEAEKKEMAETQLHFIKYASEEIIEYIQMGGTVEEWYQNKLSKVHSDMEGLHSWIEGEKRRTGMVEETELEEASLRKRIAQRGRIETKLLAMKDDDAKMAAFLINQDDQKELAKFLKSLDPKSRKAIEAVMNEGYVSHAQRKAVWASRNDEKEKKKMKKEGTDFAAHRAAQSSAPTQADREKMRKVAQLLAKERKMKKEELEEAKYYDSGWRKVSGPRKDKYGNIVKNAAKHLAKKGMAAAQSDKMKKEEVELEENAVHKIAAKYGFVKKTEKSPSTGKSTAGMVHPKTGERISSMGHMQQSFGHSRKDGSTVKTGSTADLHKHLQSKGYKMNEDVELDENNVHKIASKYGFVKTKEKSPSTGKTTTGMVHPKTGERISSMGHMQQSFGHSRKDGSTVKTGSTSDLHKHLQSKGYKMNEDVERVDELKKSTLSSYIKKASDNRALASRFSGGEYVGHKDARQTAAKRKKGIATAADKLAREEVEQTDEARSFKVPANYAAMMAKKRKKAGVSEFGKHPDKKKDSVKESMHLEEQSKEEIIDLVMAEFAANLDYDDPKDVAFKVKSMAAGHFGNSAVKSAFAPANKNLFAKAAKDHDVSSKNAMILFNTK